MKKTQILFGVIACLVGASAAQAQSTDTPGYSRKGELSPGTQAPTLAEMTAAIQHGSPERLAATLEYGEHVVCEACVPLLVAKLLDSGEPRVREMAAWWLRKQPFAAPGLVVQFRGLMKTEKDAVRRARVASALGELMDPHAVPELTDALMEDKVAAVRAAAVSALARLNSETGFAALTDALKDSDASVKNAALQVLTSSGAFRDFDALIELLGDKDAQVRTRAARVCGEYRVQGAERALIAMLEGDEVAAARKAAAFALGRVGGADGQEALSKASGTETDGGVLDAIRIAQRMPVRF